MGKLPLHLLCCLGLTALAACSDDALPGFADPPATADGGDPEDAGAGEGGGPDAAADSSTRTSTVGHACTANSQCEAPRGGDCRDALDPNEAVEGLFDLVRDMLVDADAGLPGSDLPPVDLPGGYCTAPCKTDDECGAGGSCFSSAQVLVTLGVVEPDGLQDLDGFLGLDGVCLEPCDRDTDCRRDEGYVCRSAADGSALVRQLLPVTDAGVPLLLPPPFYCLPPVPR